jgi:hypothetical protein
MAEIQEGLDGQLVRGQSLGLGHAGQRQASRQERPKGAGFQGKRVHSFTLDEK